MLYNNFLFYVFIHQFGSMEQLTWTDRKDISGPPIVMRSIVHPVDGGLVCSELSWRTPPPVDIGLNALVVYTPKSPTPRRPITSQRRIIICLFLKDFQLEGIYLGILFNFMYLTSFSRWYWIQQLSSDRVVLNPSGTLLVLHAGRRLTRAWISVESEFFISVLSHSSFVRKFDYVAEVWVKTSHRDYVKLKTR